MACEMQTAVLRKHVQGSADYLPKLVSLRAQSSREFSEFAVGESVANIRPLVFGALPQTLFDNNLTVPVRL